MSQRVLHQWFLLSLCSNFFSHTRTIKVPRHQKIPLSHVAAISLLLKLNCDEDQMSDDTGHRTQAAREALKCRRHESCQRGCLCTPETRNCQSLVIALGRDPTPYHTNTAHFLDSARHMWGGRMACVVSVGTLSAHSSPRHTAAGPACTRGPGDFPTIFLS